MRVEAPWSEASREMAQSAERVVLLQHPAAVVAECDNREAWREALTVFGRLDGELLERLAGMGKRKRRRKAA